MTAPSIEMHSDYPSFTDAVDRLREFLDRFRWPVEIRWLPDVLAHKTDRLVLDENTLLDPDEVRTRYWHAVPRERGILLLGLCHDTAFSYCHLWAPSDEDEADDHQMPDGLKLVLPENPPEISVARGWRLWRHRLGTRETPLESLMRLYPPSDERRHIHV